MPLQQLLGIELPIIQAPMAGAQGSALAVAVSNAGGLGSLPCAMLSPEVGLHLVFLPVEYDGMGGGAYDIYRLSCEFAKIDLGLATAMLAVALGTARHTLEAIGHSREFVISFPGEGMAEDTLYYGTVSGRDEDKLAVRRARTQSDSRLSPMLAARKPQCVRTRFAAMAPRSAFQKR